MGDLLQQISAHRCYSPALLSVVPVALPPGIGGDAGVPVQRLRVGLSLYGSELGAGMGGGISRTVCSSSLGILRLLQEIRRVGSTWKV